MTREEAEQALDWFRNRSKTVTMPGAKRMYLLAIEALSADGDTISRQAAIEVIDAVFPVDPMKSEYAQGITCGAALAKTYVEQLPPAQPEQEAIDDENSTHNI